MTEFVSPSSEELTNRRQVLRRRRRIRNLQSIWRVLAVSAMTVGILHLVVHPFWILRSSDQITVQGNELLSDQAIQSLLPLKYPQPLLGVKPNQASQFLKTQATIAHATVTRHLFPPRLKIYVQERHPVAVTVPLQSAEANRASYREGPVHAPGILDPQGYWMPQEKFVQTEPTFKLPQLSVRGFDRKYQAEWSSLYQALQSSPITVSEIDWRMPSDVILHTRLGKVHIGAYNAHHIQQQLATLTQLRALSSNTNAPELEYIDLSNPQRPTVKLKID